MIKKVVGLVLVILIAIGLVVLIKKRKEELARLSTPKIYPVVVKTIKPKLSRFYLTLTGLGLIKSSVDFNVTTKLSGRVLYIKNVGDRVKKGDVVVKLDDSQTRALLDKAKSELRSLKSKLSALKLTLKNMLLTHKRTKELLSVKGASIEQYQKEQDEIASLRSQIRTVKSQITAAESNINQLKTLLTYSIIKSPINGVISRKFANVGDVALPGRALCSISAKGGKYLLLELPENIKPKGVVFKGKFYRVVSLNSTFNGLYEYKADVDTTLNTDTRVKVGVVVFKGQAIKLPYEAILSDDGHDYVFVVEGKKAVPKLVKVLAVGEQGVAVKDSTLLGKELVLAKPDIFIKLRGGVQIVKE